MMRMGMSLAPRLRQVLECSACGQYIDAAPPGEVPRDPVTGQIHAVGCIALGICPVCQTRSRHHVGLTDAQLAQIALYLRTRREAKS